MRAMWVGAIVVMLAGVTVAQDQPTNPDDLNRKYQDVLAQLQAAQNRKNELATENEKLTARVADLEKQLDQAQRREAAFNERTWWLRMHYAVWQTFLQERTAILEQWRAYILKEPTALPSDLPTMLDPRSPAPSP